MVDPPEGRPLYPSSCETFKLSSYVPEYLYDFGLDTYDDKFIPGPPNAAFQFYTEAYGDAEYANGIYCDIFLSCQYSQRLRANFSVAYYFSSN